MSPLQKLEFFATETRGSTTVNRGVFLSEKNQPQISRISTDWNWKIRENLCNLWQKLPTMFKCGATRHGDTEFFFVVFSVSPWFVFAFFSEVTDCTESHGKAFKKSVKSVYKGFNHGDSQRAIINRAFYLQTSGTTLPPFFWPTGFFSKTSNWT